MKVISVSVSESDYEAFREAAQCQGTSIAFLIREAMATYRADRLEATTPLREVPVLPGHRCTNRASDKSTIYDEIADWTLDAENDSTEGEAS